MHFFDKFVYIWINLIKHHTYQHYCKLNDELFFDIEDLIGAGFQFDLQGASGVS